MTDQIITAAINDRRIITFDYDALPRIVEPHAIGFTSRQKLVFRGYQNPDLGWKLFTVDKVENLLVTADQFDRPREGYRMDDKYIPQIIAQLVMA